MISCSDSRATSSLQDVRRLRTQKHKLKTGPELEPVSLIQICQENEALREGDILRQVYILNCVQEFHTLRHRPLERFAAADQAGAAGSLVDDRGDRSLFEVVRAGRAPGIDQAGATHVAIRDLIAGEIDRVIARQFRIDALVKLAVAGIADVERFVAAVILRQLLLDDVGLNGDAQVVGLAGKIRREEVVLVLLKSRVAQIAPENGGHAELMGFRESTADFDDLAVGLIGAKINCGANGGSSHVIGFLNRAEEDLVKLVGIRQQLVVIDFRNKRNLVRIFARNRSKHAKGGRHSVAPSLDRELHDVFTVKVIGILCEAGARRMLDALVHRQDRNITGAGQPSGEEDAMKIIQNAHVPVGDRINAIDKISTGQMEPLLGYFGILETEQ